MGCWRCCSNAAQGDPRLSPLRSPAVDARREAIVISLSSRQDERGLAVRIFLPARRGEAFEPCGRDKSLPREDGAPETGIRNG